MSIQHVFWNSEEDRFRAGWRVLVQTGVWLVLLLIVQTLLNGLILDVLIPDPQGASVGTIQTVRSVLQLVSPLLMGSTVWLAGRYLDRRSLAGFGLHLDGAWWGDLSFGLLLGALLMTLVFLVERAAGWVRVTDSFVTLEGGLSFVPGILLALIGYVAVGIGEEMWSRGYILTNLAEGFEGRRMRPAAAIALATVLQGAIFALLHATNPNASVVSTFNLFLIAFLLALGYILTGELAISIGLHITWNFFQGNVFGFPVSGGASAQSFIGTEQAGPTLWTGGAFGPEAGLMGIGALLVGSLLILLWVRLRDGHIQLDREIAEPPDSAVASPDGKGGTQSQVAHA
jgi:hypothetical protein